MKTHPFFPWGQLFKTDLRSPKTIDTTLTKMNSTQNTEMEIAPENEHQNPTQWKHRGRFNMEVTTEQAIQAELAIQNMDVNKHNKKQPSLPMMYYKTEAGWQTVIPQTNNPRQAGQLKQRSTLTLRKMEQKDKMRATLEARRRAREEE